MIQTPETCTTSNTQRTDRDETANVALLPCPHCGGRADCDREPWPNSKIFSIWCSECKAGIDQSVTDANLLEAWNRRAAPTLPADVKGIIDELEYCPAIAYEPVKQAIVALTSQSALLDQLLSAAKTVMAGLDARIDEAIAKGGTAVPVFDGIAELHDAIGAASADMEG